MSAPTPQGTAADTLLATRGERKQRTRSSLLDAALKQMLEGKGLTGLSLREITREAGVVPTSFYRHFEDMDALGLALVEDSGAALRQRLRQPRTALTTAVAWCQQLQQRYQQQLDEQPQLLWFIASERSGGSPLIRRALRNQLQLCVLEMSQDWEQLQALPPLSSPALQRVCELLLGTLLDATATLLDAASSDPAQQQLAQHTLSQQLRLIMIGAQHWAEHGHD